MRNKEEVQKEITWREEEIKKLKENLTSDNQTIEYNQWRIQNLSVAIEWCKWFINE